MKINWEAIRRATTDYEDIVLVVAMAIPYAVLNALSCVLEPVWPLVPLFMVSTYKVANKVDRFYRVGGFKR